MKNFALVILTLAGLVLPIANASTSSPQITRAANAFLSTLDESQRAKVLFSFGDEEQRKRWSNFPTPVVPRAGLSLKDLNDKQKQAAMDLLATTLSERGFTKVQEIMEADEVNKLNELKHPGHPKPHGGKHDGPPPPGMAKPGNWTANDLFGKDLYFISILGSPSDSAPWMLQFGGHHLALNFTIDGERDILTPTLTGAQPAEYTLNGKTVRPLGRESDKGVAMLQSLNADQRKQAISSSRLADLVLGPGQDGKVIQPEGLQASDMTAHQKTLLLSLISEWTELVNDRAAEKKMAQMKADLDETWFLWSGPANVEIGKNIAAYYRVQGPHLVIEYAPQEDEPTLHVHTMYRDPTNDYGRSAPTK